MQTRLNASLKEFYQEFRIRDRIELNLKVLGMAKLTEFPMLSGAGVKGAGVRAIIPWVTRLATDMAVTGDRVKVRRQNMMEALSCFYSLCETSGMFFTDSQQVQFRECLLTFGVHYHVLAAHHCSLGNVRYNIVAKHHYMQHLPEFLSVNPHHISTYSEESFIAQGARFSVYAGGLST